MGGLDSSGFSYRTVRQTLPRKSVQGCRVQVLRVPKDVCPSYLFLWHHILL